jgi:hypothetical protein
VAVAIESHGGDLRVIRTFTSLSGSALMLSLVASLVSCNATEDSQPADVSQTSNEQAVDREEVPTPMNLDGQIALAMKDLAERLGVPVNSVMLSGANPVTWRSGALGCPEPGMNYTDALVPGSVIYLKVGNVIHAYHAKFAGKPFYCPRERVESPAPAGEGDLT